MCWAQSYRAFGQHLSPVEPAGWGSGHTEGLWSQVKQDSTLALPLLALDFTSLSLHLFV